MLLTQEVSCCKDTSYYCIVIDSLIQERTHMLMIMFTAKLYILSLVLICSTLSYHFIIENLWALLLIVVSSSYSLFPSLRSFLCLNCFFSFTLFGCVSQHITKSIFIFLYSTYIKIASMRIITYMYRFDFK